MANNSSSRQTELGDPRSTPLVHLTNTDCQEMSYKSLEEGFVVDVLGKHYSPIEGHKDEKMFADLEKKHEWLEGLVGGDDSQGGDDDHEKSLNRREPRPPGTN
ncbi:hypothetical protein INS49_012780 [Diaporthe citri]|uniref:uncharacterized protein n=1 Tax=Diaporthe citri TaxID=83186 RepID=UPI001C814B31|nr:uncharacterized protein INS49_012780 [Diaporthe citri]KAG6359259.1 hypothetical protein INS49_012780 [Diaporthe citri]